MINVPQHHTAVAHASHSAQAPISIGHKADAAQSECLEHYGDRENEVLQTAEMGMGVDGAWEGEGVVEGRQIGRASCRERVSSPV